MEKDQKKAMIGLLSALLGIGGGILLFVFIAILLVLEALHVIKILI